MEWLELAVDVDREAVEATSELFAQYGYNQGVVVEETIIPQPDEDYIVDPTAPVQVRTYIVADEQAEGDEHQPVMQDDGAREAEARVALAEPEQEPGDKEEDRERRRQSRVQLLTGVEPALRRGPPAEQPYVDSLTLEQASLQDVMLAYEMDGLPLSRAHGAPLRLVIPEMYGYKNVKWLTHIELVPKLSAGFWEQRGYDVDAWVGRSNGY